MDYPLLFFPLALVMLAVAGFAGSLLRARYAEAVRLPSFNTVESSVLGLMALLLGFSFAMAVSRYDLRKSLEVEEANAIGTTWLRTAALDESPRTEARTLLKNYAPERIAYFDAGTDDRAMADHLSRSNRIQSELWRIVTGYASGHRDTFTTQLVVSLNDMIDLSEKRTAANENRIPGAAWAMLLLIAAAANALVGIGSTVRSRALLWVMPVVVGASLALILDLDSSRAGFVLVHQNSMVRVAEQMAVGPQ